MDTSGPIYYINKANDGNSVPKGPIFDNLLTVKDVSNALNVSEKAVYKWASTGKLPSIKLGACLRFRPAIVE
jgi:excisionase family DNA binding protein